MRKLKILIHGYVTANILKKKKKIGRNVTWVVSYQTHHFYANCTNKPVAMATEWLKTKKLEY